MRALHRLRGLYLLAISLLVCDICRAQLPDLTFRNIDIWPEGSEGYVVRDVVEDTLGFLWFGTTAGIYRYDGHEIRHYILSRDSSGFTDNYITRLHLTPTGALWVGTLSGGLGCYDQYTDRFTEYIEPNGQVGRLYEIYSDKEILWLGTSKGLAWYNPQNHEFALYQPSPSPLDPRGFDFRSIIPDRTEPGYLWVAGLDGLYKYHIDENSFEYHDMPFGISPKTRYMIIELHMDENGFLWAGSWGGGMLSYQPELAQWAEYKPVLTRDNRWKAVIFDILRASDENFWVAGSDGFGKFNTSSGTFAFYDFNSPQQGAIDSSFHYNAILKTGQGNLIVTRINGFSIATPPGAERPMLDKQPVTTDIRIDGAPVFSDTSIHHVQSLNLGGDERDVVFTLASPGNFSPATRYAFMLEGYDDGWQNLKGGRTVRYTNLSGGDYSFRYRASTDGVNWIEGNPITVHKTIFFWRTPWFFILCSLLIIGFIAAIYFVHLRSARKELALKAEFDRKEAELELKALRSQMNPHFMFNSLNSIKHYILTNEPLKASEYLTNFATLVRSTLHNSSHRLVPLSEEIETLLLYVDLEQLRFKDKFHFDCKISADVDTENTRIPPMILQPFVENAIWHGLMHKKEKGALSIRIQRQNGYVKCDIEDDGVGRKKAEELKSKSATGYKSMGMGITKNRIDIHNKMAETGIELIIEDKINGHGEGVGTKVSILIPAMQHSEFKNVV